MFRRCTVALLLVLLASPATASDGRGKLTEAIVAFGRGDLAAAKQALDAAEKAGPEPKVLAQVHRQRGIIAQVEARRLDAVVSFMKALYYAPEIQLPGREHAGEVTRLFECAGELRQRGDKEAAVAVQHTETFATANWVCPTKAPPEPPPNLTTAPVVPPEDESSFWKSPVVWGVAAAIVGAAAGAGIAIGFAASGGTYGGTRDTVLRVGED